jgi:hypothetical protein
MYFESHLLAMKQFVAHIPLFMRHNLFCDYFMNHKRFHTAPSVNVVYEHQCIQAPFLQSRLALQALQAV